MTTHNYSNECNPPCPLIPIQISTVLDRTTYHDKIAFLDTGADMSGIPPKLVQELGIEASGKQPIEDAYGEEENKDTYRLNIVMNGKTFTNHEFFEYTDEDYILIGRDIMNEFHICFDVINLNVNIHDDT